MQAIVTLLRDAKKSEARFIMRALQGKLRIGLAEGTVLVALAHATLKSQAHLGATWSGAAAGQGASSAAEPEAGEEEELGSNPLDCEITLKKHADAEVKRAAAASAGKKGT